MTRFLNRHANEGWSAITIDKSVDRVFLLFSRENYVIVFEKDNTPEPLTPQTPKEEPKTPAKEELSPSQLTEDAL